MSTVIISDMYLFLVYVVLSLGSTDDAFLTTICLRKPHSEHQSPSFSKGMYFYFNFQLHLRSGFSGIVREYSNN